MTSALAAGVVAGDRRALARAITLVESRRADHKREALALLDDVLPRTGGAVRLAVTGSPGAGKSTFIEALGVHLTDAGHRVAVLAIDPSSSRTGGSILGDKTRMSVLAKDPNAFIRPSPAGGTLGGVARRTRETMLLCEAGGFDVVVVETVGVGQSEAAVSDMTDCVLLLVAPGGGDELQGIKRGVIELADVLVVTKSDGDLETDAQRVAGDLSTAVRLLRPKHAGWSVPVLQVSAPREHGIADTWRIVHDFVGQLRADGLLEHMRQEQDVRWLRREIREGLVESFEADPGIATRLEAAVDAVRARRRSPVAAAQELLEGVPWSP